MSRSFNTCMCDAEKEEESRRLCMLEHEALEPFSLEQRSCDQYRSKYLQPQVELSKVDSNCSSSTNPKESSFEFQNLLTSINSSGLQTELFRETLAKEHWKNLYFQSQAWLLKVYSLWTNLRKQLQENIGYLAVDSASDNDNNIALKREISILSLVLDELHVQAEFLQQQENQAQNQLIPRDVSPVELEQNECRHYMLSEEKYGEHYAPKAQKPSVSFEINSSGSKQKEIYAGKAQTSKETNYRAADTESVARFLSVKGVPDCELRQRISLEQKHKRQQTLDSQRFGVPEEEEEESNQAFLLLERHCDHRSCLIKETAKKDYYKRQYIKSQAELYKMFSKLEKFNVCFEENVTEFENVSLACLNLQKEIFKVKSEKEHYINQFLQFHAELLRVHSMWQDLKIELENKMFEFENTSPSCSATQYLSSDIDRLSLALDELLNQLEASRQNIDQSEYSAMASEELAKGTFSAELEESEQRRHKFLDSEDNQYDDSEEQDLNGSFRRIVTDSAEEKIFAVRENVSQEFEEDMTVPESPSSSGDESFEKVNERIKFARKREEKLYQLVDPKDRFSEEPEYDKHRLYMIWEEEYEVSDTTESEPEQISALEDELAEQRCYTQQTQGSEMLCVPDEVVMKPLLEKQKVYHLEAELSNERVEKDYYKKLYNESQNVVLQLHAAVDKYNLHHIEKSAEPETSSSSRNDDDDDDDESAEDSIKGVWKSVAKLDFQVQTIKQLVEKFRNVPDPKEVLSTKDSSLQNDLRDTFDAPQPAQLETTAPESDQELMTKLVLLQQRICDLEAQLSKEKDQKNHYNKLYNELEVELLKMHTALDEMNHKYEDRTAVSNTAYSSESDGNNYENENIQAARRVADEFECKVQNISELTGRLKKLAEPCDDIQAARRVADEFECKVQNISELTEKLKKLAGPCEANMTDMIVEEPKETISLSSSSSDIEDKEYTSYTFLDTENDDLYVPTLQDYSVAVETHAPLTALLETSAATTEEPRGTRYVSLNPNFQTSGTSLDITAPEYDQEQISTLGGGPLTGTHDAERSKESQSLSQPQAEISSVFSLYQRVSEFDTELSREREQKDYYHKLYNESQVELQKLRAILEKTPVPDTASSSGNYDKDHVDENIKDALKCADELECGVQNLSELTEKINKLAEPHKANLKGTFSLETDQSAASSTFLDAKQYDHDVPNLQHPSDSVETTDCESGSEDTSFATPKKFEDTQAEEFILYSIEAPESDEEQISTSEDDVLQRRQAMEEINEEEITQLSSEQQSVYDLEVDVLANATSTGSDNAELLHLPSDVLQLQIHLSEQSDTIPNQVMPPATPATRPRISGRRWMDGWMVMPTEVIPSATLGISTQDVADSHLSEADENQTMPQEKKVLSEVTTPECEQVEVLTEKFFTTDRDAAAETIIPEEETAVIEAENRDINREFYNISFGQSEETDEVTESTSLGLSFSETEDDVFDKYRQDQRIPSEPICSTCLLERSSSSDELRQDDRVQETQQVRRRTMRFGSHSAGRTHHDEAPVPLAVRRRLPSVCRSSAYLLKYILLVAAFSLLGTYIYLVMRPHFDVNYSLFELLEPFCTFENVLPVPF